jgi:hypothetical protein
MFPAQLTRPIGVPEEEFVPDVDFVEFYLKTRRLENITHILKSECTCSVYKVLLF